MSLFNKFINRPGTVYFLASCLLPGLILTSVVSSQPWKPSLHFFGNLISCLTGLAVVLFVLSSNKHKVLLLVTILGIILTRILRVLCSGWSVFNIGYFILLNAVFCFSGALACFGYRKLICKQLMIICLLNVTIMLPQIMGAGEWCNILTVPHGSDDVMELRPTLFVDKLTRTPDNIVLEIPLRQRRPSGLLYANQYLSIVLSFALFMLFSVSRKIPLSYIIIVCAMMVLAMSKIVFLEYSIIVFVLLLLGDRARKVAILKSVLCCALFLSIYKFLFPWLYGDNFSFQALSWSIFTRLKNITTALYSDNIIKIMMDSRIKSPNYLYSPYNIGSKSIVSGYTIVMQYLPYIIVPTLVMAYLYIKGFRKKHGHDNDLKWVSLFALIVVIIFPAVGVYWRSQLYWFIAGFALWPVFHAFDAELLKERIE